MCQGENGTRLCVNQHVPVGGVWAWYIGLLIEIDWELAVFQCENECSLCV